MAQSMVSPLTGIFEEDNVIIDFGEHVGKSVLEVADTFPDYYERMIETKDENDCDFTIRRGFGKQYLLNMNLQLTQ